MVWNNSCYQSICPVNPEQRERYYSFALKPPSFFLKNTHLSFWYYIYFVISSFFARERNIYVTDFFRAEELCVPGVYLFCNWAISSHQSRWKVNILFDNTQISRLFCSFKNKCSLWKEFGNSGQVLRLLKAVGKASVSWGSAKPTSLTKTKKRAGWQSGSINNSNFPNFFTTRIWPQCRGSSLKKSLKLICDVWTFIQWPKEPSSKFQENLNLMQWQLDAVTSPTFPLLETTSNLECWLQIFVPKKESWCFAEKWIAEASPDSLLLRFETGTLATGHHTFENTQWGKVKY